MWLGNWGIDMVFLIPVVFVGAFALFGMYLKKKSKG